VSPQERSHTAVSCDRKRSIDVEVAALAIEHGFHFILGLAVLGLSANIRAKPALRHRAIKAVTLVDVRMVLNSSDSMQNESEEFVNSAQIIA
jgi:hypothetical protein